MGTQFPPSQGSQSCLWSYVSRDAVAAWGAPYLPEHVSMEKRCWLTQAHWPLASCQNLKSWNLLQACCLRTGMLSASGVVWLNSLVKICLRMDKVSDWLRGRRALDEKTVWRTGSHRDELRTRLMHSEQLRDSVTRAACFHIWVYFWKRNAFRWFKIQELG